MSDWDHVSLGYVAMYSKLFRTDTAVHLHFVAVGAGFALIRRLPMDHDAICLDACEIDMRSYRDIEAEKVYELVDGFIEDQTGAVDEPGENESDAVCA